jgi:predicted ATPase
MQEAIALAERLDHPFSRAQVLGFANLLALLRHEAHTIPDRVQAMLALSQQHNFELFSGWGRIFVGRTMAEAGQPLAGVDAIREGLRATEATGAVIGLPYLRLLLAEAYALGGRVEAALNSVNEALALAEAHEEHWCESELWRRKGEWLLIQPVPDFSQAEACLRQAYDRAHRHSMLSLELRAAAALVRLSQTSGDRQKRSAARRILADTLGRFQEGFGTPDWIEAESLLRAPE